jgi:hypothetical protein
MISGVDIGFICRVLRLPGIQKNSKREIRFLKIDFAVLWDVVLVGTTRE